MVIRYFAALLLLLPAAASAKSVKIMAFDPGGRLLDSKGLLRHIAPAAKSATGVPIESSGLFLTDSIGIPAEGRPWWRKDADKPVWTWKNAERIKITLPWPIEKDGFSTVSLDGKGKGYTDGQTILLNEEIAVTAYHRMRTSMKTRMAQNPVYRPSKRVKKMVASARKMIRKGHAAKEPRKKAAIFDQALSITSFAWQQLLYEHGEQLLSDAKYGARQRFGLSLDETLTDRMHDYEKLADQISESGATWVRIVFGGNLDDFTYAKKSSFAPYDKFISLLRERKIRIMGSILDSLLWPKNLTPKAYQERAKNLASHYQDDIRSWEVASEPNANWIGGTRTRLPRKLVLTAIQKAIVSLKRVDSSLETVATLHWWEGTSPETEDALFPWLDWAVPRGFGRGIDVIALSLYPHRHPLGIAFDPVFSELHRRFPEKRLMLGGFSFADSEDLQGYWWLEATNVRDARKDLIVLFLGTAPAIPNSIGGGFYWPTLRLMLPSDRKKPSSIYFLYKRTLKRLKK